MSLLAAIAKFYFFFIPRYQFRESCLVIILSLRHFLIRHFSKKKSFYLFYVLVGIAGNLQAKLYKKVQRFRG